VNQLYLNDEDNCAASRLENGATLEESFPAPLPPKCVHVIVQLPLDDPIPPVLAPTSFEQYITIDLEDITTYEDPPLSVLDLNEISVATSSVFVAEFEKMLRRKQWLPADTNPEMMTKVMKLVVGDKFQFELDHFFLLDGEPPEPLDVVGYSEITRYVLLLHITSRTDGLGHLHNSFDSDRGYFLEVLFLGLPSRDDIIEFLVESEWVFPLVIASERRIPREKWAYTHNHGAVLTVLDVPNMIIDVGYHRDEGDHCKILLQAACLARLANALRIDQSIPFIVTAIFIDNQLSASRYLVFQPDISKRRVFYTRTDFDLKSPLSVFEFFRQLHNLSAPAKKQTENLRDPAENVWIVAAEVEKYDYPPISSFQASKKKEE